MVKYFGIAGDILDGLEVSGYFNKGVYEPGTSKKQYTKEAVLLFYRSELLYDIKNLAFVEGDVMPTDDEHDRHQVIDIGEEGNVDRVTRVMDLAVARCRELLYPYSKIETEDEEYREDYLENVDEYIIHLKLPDDFSKTTLTYLERLIHEFIVYRVLADWMALTNIKNPNSAANWLSKLQDIEDDIESTLNARIHRVRKTQTPF